MKPSFHIFYITNIRYIYGFRHIFVTDICHISSWGCEISNVCHIWNFFDFRQIRFFQNGNFGRNLFGIKFSDSIDFDLNISGSFQFLLRSGNWLYFANSAKIGGLRTEFILRARGFIMKRSCLSTSAIYLDLVNRLLNSFDCFQNNIFFFFITHLSHRKFAVFNFYTDSTDFALKKIWKYQFSLYFGSGPK